MDYISKNPSAFVAALALIYSIIVTITNFLIFKMNLKEERGHKRDFAFYELLVLPGCKKILGFTHIARVQLDELLGPCAKKIESGESARDSIEKSVEIFDRANRDLDAEAVVVMGGYSKELRDDISVIVEKYYDDMTSLFSEFDRKTIGTEFAARQVALYRKITQRFVDEAVMKIRKSCPTGN